MPTRSRAIKHQDKAQKNDLDPEKEKIIPRKGKRQKCDTEETYAKRLKRKKDEASREDVATEPGPDMLINNNQEKCQMLFGLKPRMSPYTVKVFTPPYLKSCNIVHHLHGFAQGMGHKNLHKSSTECIVKMLSDMQLSRIASPFDRRVTAMEWHPSNPNVVAVGSKGGDIILWDTCNIKNEKFIQGMGAGGIINAIKFWPHDYNKILTAAVDGTVTLHDVEGRNTQILADTMNAYDFWYCSVDVHSSRKIVAAGDNVGKLQFLTYDGNKTFEFRLHKNKITHCEFSPTEEWMLCTSSTDQTVQLWDIRNLKDRKSSLFTLKHDKPINSAYFSRTNGCRLLTTDQNNQVRVYLAPEWQLEKTILHPHRFFQHITPIKATWHPLLDLAVVGRYPDPNFPGYHDGELRTIDIIDVDKEKVVANLHDPGAPGLICVNKFNIKGDTLVSGMGVNILVWKGKEEAAKMQESLVTKMKGDGLDHRVRGRNSGSSRSNQSKKADGQTKAKLKLKTTEEENEKKKTKTAKLKLKVLEDNQKKKK